MMSSQHQSASAKLRAYAEAMDSVRQIVLTAIAGAAIILAWSSLSQAQDSLPFRVSNAKNMSLPADTASRIYYSACDRVARTIRPERPPHLEPKFLLVLGTENNETVRQGPVSEVHLKRWDPAFFAQAVVVLAAREIINTDEVASITREALTAAQATVTVENLRSKR